MKSFIFLITVLAYTACEHGTIVSQHADASYEVTASKLIVRSDPINTSRNIGVLTKGDVVAQIEDTEIYQVIDGEAASWRKIALHDGMSGYVFGKYLMSKEKNEIEISPALTSPDVTLVLKNGKKIVFKSKKGEYDTFFAEYYRDIGFYCVARTWGWESFTYYMVNVISGSTTKMWHGVRLFSPDKKRILITNWDCEATFNPNGMQIFKITGTTLVKEYELYIKDPSCWGARDPKWVNNQTVQMKKVFTDSGDSKNPRPPDGFITLEYKGNRWFLNSMVKNK